MDSDRSMLLVDLGDQMRVVEERVKNGSYASPDAVIRAALEAFDQGECERNAWLLELADESLADPEPSIPAVEVFAEIYAMHRDGKIRSSR